MSDEEKEEKPKKAFQIKIVVWDDGEVDADIREYRKLGTGRGAPSLCGPLSSKDLTKALKNMMISPEAVRESIAIELGIDEEGSTSTTSEPSSSTSSSGYDEGDETTDAMVDAMESALENEVEVRDEVEQEEMPDTSDMDMPDFSDLEVE